MNVSEAEFLSETILRENAKKMFPDNEDMQRAYVLGAKFVIRGNYYSIYGKKRIEYEEISVKEKYKDYTYNNMINLLLACKIEANSSYSTEALRKTDEIKLALSRGWYKH